MLVVLLVACGGSTTDDGSSGGSGAGASGGTRSNGGSTSQGGSNAGRGGSAGTSSRDEQAFLNCLRTCDLLGMTACDNAFDGYEGCRRVCDDLGTRDEACDTAYAEAYACAVNEQPFGCDQQGNVATLCGPCDDELRNLSSLCDDNEFTCVF